jgi:hypothetical protein
VNKFNIKLKLDRITILFGDKNKVKFINLIIMWDKYYIYAYKCKEIKPSLNTFKEILKGNIRIEKCSLQNEQSVG